MISRPVLRRIPLLIVSTFAALMAAVPSLASWPANGLMVSDYGIVEGVLPDDAGGAYIVLLKVNSIALQHVSADGDLLLGVGGVHVAVGTSSGEPFPDGEGGMYIPYINGSLVRVVRVSLDGGSVVPQWDHAVCSTAISPADVNGGGDGAGGGLISWSDKRTLGTPNTQYKVFAQRVDGDGAVLWQNDGVMVMQYSEIDPRGGVAYLNTRAAGIVRRGSGEANVMCAYETLFSGWTMASKRLDSGGGLVGTQSIPVEWSEGNIVADDGGGAFMAQGGSLTAFSADGLSWSQHNQGTGGGETALDGAGGVLHVWMYATSTRSLRCQLYSASGTELWTPGGVEVATGSLWAYADEIAPDHSGGAWVAWLDYRSGYRNVYYQHLDENGSPLLLDNGVPASVHAQNDENPRLVSSTDGHAIVTWTNSGNPWAQRLDTELPLAVAISAFTATAGRGGVRLDATFRSDLGVQRVNVYRGDGDAPMRLLDTATPSSPGRFDYVDADVVDGGDYRYQIGVVDADGEFLSAVEGVSLPELNAALEQNRPNPFNPTTTIAFTFPERVHATLTVYDSAGRQVRRLVDATLGPGRESITWNGRDDHGVAVASGVYFYRLRAGTFTATRRMVLLK